MMVVERELVLDLTEETEDYKVVLKRAIETVLNNQIHEFTLVSHLNRRFRVRDIAKILEQTNNLELLSLFSIALSGTPEDFAALGRVLRKHQGLKEVHMVDCGMLGTFDVEESGEQSSVSTVATRASRNSTTIESKASTRTASKTAKTTGMDSSAMSISVTSASMPPPPSKKFKTAKTTGSIADSSAMSISVASAAMPPPAPSKTPTMDVILNALATIPTLENVELYGIPMRRYDKVSDGDEESGHKVMLREGEADQDIAMVPMGMNDSVTLSDNDFLADYNGDIRGIPTNGKRGCGITRKLDLMMSPESVGALCRSPALTNLGMEDLNLQKEHIEEIAKALSRKETKVKEIKLWGCNIDDESAIALAKMLKVNKTLLKLDVSHNHIGEDGCKAIAVALRGNETLRCLNLMGNECAETYDMVSEGGCYEALLELLEKNKTLTDLILEPFEQDDASSDIPEFINIPAIQPDDISSASE